MPDPALVRRRVVAQGLATRPFNSPEQVVSALGAMQGQDLPGVMASVALRLTESDPAAGLQAVIEAFNDGSIVRGYPMRGTVFLMAAQDARWMTELCSAGPLRAQVKRRSQLGLDDEQVQQAHEILVAECSASPVGLSRKVLFERWDAAGLGPAGGRGYHLLSHLIATGVAIYGPWNGSDNNVVVAQKWLPAGSSIAERFNGDELAAIAQMLLRYLTSHGPATLRDFAWWTKLPLTRIRKALPLVMDGLESDDASEPSFWRPGLDDEIASAGNAAEATYLLPGFDELVLGYPDRMALLDEQHHPLLVPGNNGIFQRGILRKGQIIGTWRRAGTAGRRRLELSGFAELPGVVAKEATRLHDAFPYVAA